MAKKIAVIGGGINGLCIAWRLQESGHQVTLYEKDRLLQATSSASSKLLHGGLRYLENGEFRLVKEALKERSFWIKNTPELAWPIKIHLPIYKSSHRPPWKIRLGLTLYDLLSGKESLGKHKKENLDEFTKNHPELKSENLKAVYSYYDGQMNDNALGNWVKDKTKQAGVEILEHHTITKITKSGQLAFKNNTLPCNSVAKRKELSLCPLCLSGEQKYDQIINTTGPWADQLLKDSQLKSNYSLDLIRGTHIYFDEPLKSGYILEVPKENRIIFALPYKGKALVGTTEVRQSITEPIEPTKEEITYLTNTWNHYFKQQKTMNDVKDAYAGVRPLIHSNKTPGKATREYAIERKGRILNIFGGKWTTARALADKVTKIALA